jgi:hypothetical protein
MFECDGRQLGGLRARAPRELHRQVTRYYSRPPLDNQVRSVPCPNHCLCPPAVPRRPQVDSPQCVRHEPEIVPLTLVTSGPPGLLGCSLSARTEMRNERGGCIRRPDDDHHDASYGEEDTE